MPDFQNSKRVSIYLSTDFEVDTINILKKLFQDQKEVKSISLNFYSTQLFSPVLGFCSNVFWQWDENGKVIWLWRLRKIATDEMEY